MISEDTLLATLSRGADRGALGDFFERNQAAIFRTCYGVLRRRDLAEDAVQETFLTVMRRGATQRAEGRERGWLHRVAVNASLQVLRAERRRAQRDRSVARTRPEAVGATSGALDRADLRRRIEALPARWRLPILLRYEEGLSYAEIASALECPEGTIACRLHEGIARLRNALLATGLVLLASEVEAAIALLPPHQFTPALAAKLQALASSASTHAPVPHAFPAAAPVGAKALAAAALLAACLACVVSILRAPDAELRVPSTGRGASATGMAPERVTIALRPAVGSSVASLPAAVMGREADPSIRPALGLCGRVVDAETGEPIEGAKAKLTFVARRTTQVEPLFIDPVADKEEPATAMRTAIRDSDLARWTMAMKTMKDVAVRNAVELNRRPINITAERVTKEFLAEVLRAGGTMTAPATPEPNVTTDARGVFRFEPAEELADRHLYLKADGRTWQEAEFSMTDLGTIRDYPVARGWEAVLIVRGPHGECIDEGLSFTIHSAGENWDASGTVEKIASATYRIGGLCARMDLPDQVRITVRHADYAPGEASGFAAAMRTRRRAEVEARLEEGAAVSGTVCDATGRALADAAVSAWPKGANDAGEVKSARTDSQGRYRIAGLVPGAWRVWAERGADALAKVVEIVVTERDAPDLRLVCAPPGEILGVVTDAKGQPLEGRCIRLTYDAVQPNTNRELYANQRMTDAAGRFRMRVAPCHAYDLEMVNQGKGESLTVETLGSSADRIELRVKVGAAGEKTEDAGTQLRFR